LHTLDLSNLAVVPVLQHISVTEEVHY
jgi:hypothetical protein